MTDRPQLPVTTPLAPTTPEQAVEIQQRLVRAITESFPDGGMFRSDVGVYPGLGRPQATAAAEAALAKAFQAPAAALVQGAGTGAIRCALSAGPWAGTAAGQPRRLLVHEAPDYPTTAVTFRDAQVELVRVDCNDDQAFRAAVQAADSPGWVYLQHTRQQLNDSYDLAHLIGIAREAGRRVIVDDNYSAIRTPRIGAQMGAAASAFSLFKLHGPESVAVVVGDQDIVDGIHQANYSGGGQVQGHQAIAALQALVLGPLNWAAQSVASAVVAERLNAGEVPGVVSAAVANAQDRCVIALLDEPIAQQIPALAAGFGASPYPVGSNSKYEVAPLVYRMSSSSSAADPELAKWAIRINPMRAGADLVLDILRAALQAAKQSH